RKYYLDGGRRESPCAIGRLAKEVSREATIRRSVGRLTRDLVFNACFQADSGAILLTSSQSTPATAAERHHTPISTTNSALSLTMAGTRKKSPRREKPLHRGLIFDQSPGKPCAVTLLDFIPAQNRHVIGICASPAEMTAARWKGRRRRVWQTPTAVKGGFQDSVTAMNNVARRF